MPTGWKGKKRYIVWLLYNTTFFFLLFFTFSPTPRYIWRHILMVHNGRCQQVSDSKCLFVQWVRLRRKSGASSRWTFSCWLSLDSWYLKCRLSASFISRRNGNHHLIGKSSMYCLCRTLNVEIWRAKNGVEWPTKAGIRQAECLTSGEEFKSCIIWPIPCLRRSNLW